MKGQQMRIYDPENKKRVQGETSCELHISIETESEANKDSADNWDYPAFMGYSFDLTTEVQISSFTAKDKLSYRPTDFTPGAKNVLSLTLFNEDNSFATTFVRAPFICTSVSYRADNKKTIIATIKHEGSGEITQS